MGVVQLYCGGGVPTGMRSPRGDFMPTNRLLHLFAIAALTLAPTLGLGAQEGDSLADEAPAPYPSELAPLLTPAEDVLSLPAPAGAGNHSVMLREILYRTETDGRLLRVQHEILRAETVEGLPSVARARFTFREGSQRVHLALARTHLGDGQWRNSPPDSVRLERPPGGAPGTLELVVLFDQVQVGRAVEYVVVVEQEQARIPGHFTAFLAFEAPAALARGRWLVDLPQDLGKDLRLTPIGTTPEVEQQQVDDRLRFEWKMQDAPPRVIEPSAPPVEHTGPGVWLSTLPDWGTFANWYRSLLPLPEVPPSLAEAATAWLDGATEGPEIAQRLHRGLVSTVRFGGHSLGAGAFGPRPPAQVWESQRGNAQDLAFLLHALLKRHGIASQLALLSSRHAGALETRSPDFRVFDQVLLAIEGPGGEILWSDPTVPFLELGFLAPRTADRPALLVLEEGYRFTTTPKVSSGHLDLSFDLQVGPAGQLAGSGRVVANRVRGAVLRGWFEGLEGEALSKRLQRFLDPFFPGVQVVVAEAVESPGERGSWFEIRHRMVVWNAIDPAAGGAVRMPHGGEVFTELPRSLARRWPYFQPTESTRVTLTLRLPPGWGASLPPPRLRVEGNALAALGQWQREGGVLSGELRYEQRRSLVPTEAYGSLARGMARVEQWLFQPVSIGPRVGPVAPTTPGPATPEPAAPEPAAPEPAAPEPSESKPEPEPTESSELEPTEPQSTAPEPPAPAPTEPPTPVDEPPAPSEEPPTPETPAEPDESTQEPDPAFEDPLAWTLQRLAAGERESVFERLDALDDGDDLNSALGELQALARDRQAAESFWSVQDAWWPSWQNLADRLDAPLGDAAAELDPLLRALRQSKDRDDFLQHWASLWQAGRFRPAALTHALAATPLAVERFPERAQALRNLALAVLEADPFHGPEERRAGRLQQAALYFESGRPADSTRLAQQLFQDAPPDDPRRPRMALLWGVSALALGEGQEEAAAALEAALAGPAGGTPRALLQDTLISLRNALAATSTAADPFIASLEGWLQTWRPGWYEFAEPESLDHPEVGDPRRAIAQDTTAWNGLSKIKIALLAAQDPSHPRALREAFFTHAFLGLGRLQGRYSDERRLLRSVMDNEAFPRRVRQEAWIGLLDNAFAARLDDLLGQLLGHPLGNDLPEARQPVVEGLAERARHRRETTPQIEKAIEELLSRPLGVEDGHYLVELLGRLLARGSLDAAERVVESMGTLRLATGDTMAASRLRLEALEALGQTRDLQNVVDALQRVALDHFTASDVTEPPFWRDLRYPEALDLLPRDQARDARLWELLGGETDPRLLPWWMGALLPSLPAGPVRAEIALEMTLAAARFAPDDETRLWFVLFGLDGIDDDNAVHRRRFFEGLVAYEDPTQYPLTGLALRALRAEALLRRGHGDELEVALEGLIDGIAGRITDRLRLRHALLQGDTDTLRSLLASLPAERLEEPRTLHLHLRAARATGDAELVARLQGIGAAALAETVLSTWATPERWDIFLVFQLSEVLFGRPGYPRAWVDDLLPQIQNTELRSLVELRDAELRGDWPRALQHAQILRSEDPNDHDRAWPVGRAAAQLGKEELAREALQTFVESARDHLDRAEALRLLRVLDGAQTVNP